MVYIGWLKHAHFDRKLTFDWPFWGQLLKIAFRSDDWWQFVESREPIIFPRTIQLLITEFELGYFIEASGSMLAGRVMQSQDWGHATSIPPNVDEGICSKSTISGVHQDNSSSLVEEIGNLLNGTSAFLNQTASNAIGRQGNGGILSA